jgi:hypothetical protein
MAALASGFEALGWRVTWQRFEVFTRDQAGDFDVIVIGSLHQKGRELRDTYAARGVASILVDLPPLRGFGEHYAVLPGRLGWVPPGPLPSDRAEEFGLEMKPRQRGGEAVFVCGQLAHDASHGMDFTTCRRWAERTIELLSAATFRPIFWRPHPREAQYEMPAVPLSNAQERSLAEDLADAWCVVTYNSSAGLEALLAGVPVISDPSAYYSELCGTDLAFVDDAALPILRQRWDFFSRLAYVQWSLEEMESGEAAAFILPHVMKRKAA